VQILVAVANTACDERGLKMEKVSVSPAFGHGSVGPKATAKAALQGRSPYRASVWWMASFNCR
jgi:hypothetical protein